jgi:carbon-monoxide dehydrogenase small subunit
MLMMAADHLEKGGATDDASLREALSGNICRCTGYSAILESVRRAARALAETER